MTDGLGKQGFRFVVGGAANTVFSYAIYWLLLPWVPYLWAYTVSYGMAIFSGFAVNTWFVFRVRWSWRKFAAFPFIHLLNFGAGFAIVWISTEFLGVPTAMAPVIATLAVVPLGFLLTRALLRTRERL